jgi:hypothetical protein
MCLKGKRAEGRNRERKKCTDRESNRDEHRRRKRHKVYEKTEVRHVARTK